MDDQMNMEWEEFLFSHLVMVLRVSSIRIEEESNGGFRESSEEMMEKFIAHNVG